MPQIIGSDVTSLRHANRAAILGILRRRPFHFHAAAGVAQELGLSRPTAARQLSELADEGWAELRLAHTGNVGRPTRTFRLNPRRHLVAAVDLGANNLLVALADLSGTVVRRRYAPHGHPGSDAAMAGHAANAVRELFDELRGEERTAGRPAARGATGTYGGIAAVAVSLPATVDAVGGVHAWHDSPAWVTPELPALFAAALPDDVVPGSVEPGDAGSPQAVTVRFEAAPLAALAAELAQGCLRAADPTGTAAAPGPEDAVFVLAGDVTGAAPLVRGRIYRGSRGAAGDVGGLPGVGWREATDRVLGSSGAKNLDELVAWGLEGRDDSVHALRHYATDLAPGLELLVRAYDPSILVLGGCLAPAGELVRRPLAAALHRALGSEVSLICAEVEHVDAPMLGAVSAALDDVAWGAA